uniref:Pectinesterase inhibitor domain-containing protein n=1 Tax=Leersia perrieri TaxID=77586 RepID=A0A0D9W0Z6_9ORYZ
MAATRGNTLLLLLILLSASTLLQSHTAWATIPLMMACAKTPHPEVCITVLSAIPEIRNGGASVATPRSLAEHAVRAAASIGGAAGTYARAELDIVKDTDLWQCLDECAQDIEEAVSHLDDTEGDVDVDAKFRDVRLFMDVAERDTWSCDESCRDAPESPVKAAMLDKNEAFERFLRVTGALIEQAIGSSAGGAGDAPAASAPEPYESASP